ncbi:Kinesin motor domain profile [Nakaseomyces glabratus]|nr:Kinesin motor domain profile [Nakaseomyces glabratus]KAH7610039.1 Kinesin motor domain profile [Nakaseomyces glabratus]
MVVTTEAVTSRSERDAEPVQEPLVEKLATEELNILVAVRCRGRNEREIKAKSSVVVDVPDNGVTNEVSINTTDDVGIAAKMNSKTYTVDKVFGPSASQKLVYEEIAEPLFQDFIKGYNCTILVYGMTSTGKTYTMTGDEKLHNGELGDAAGIIPRVLFELFDTLEANKDDYLVKCSFVELYNEELKDLLDSTNTATNSDNKKLRIFDSNVNGTSASGSSSRSSSRNNSPRSAPDNSRAQMLRRKLGRHNTTGNSKISNNNHNKFSRFKQTSQESTRAHASNNHQNVHIPNNNSNNTNQQQSPIDQSASIYIQNLEEFHITSAMEGLQLLQKGLKQRQVASTKMNDFSSRSHSIFTITLYKEQNGELFRVSKMNLVDLAGSENISRSGAMNQRAKEAGSINQSLLTLGRVINSLADKSEHIPFRESKLTRLLQDSLGGNTKTALIATISPAKMTSEETCSTLEYASKAKNIKNKPQLGAFIMKDILVRSITSELAKIKSDLLSTKSKEGVYMSHEHYKDLHYDIECYKTELEESKRAIESLTAQNAMLQQERLSLKDDNACYKANIASLKDNVVTLQSSLKEQITKETNIRSLLKDVQGANEEMKKTIHLFEFKQQELQQSISTFISDEISNIRDTLKKHIEYLQNNGDLKDTEISGNLMRLEKEVVKVIKAAEEEASKSYGECVKMMLKETPRLFESVSGRLDNISKLAEENHSKIAETLSDVSEEYNNLKQYLTNNFFKNNHEELLSHHVQNTYAQLEENSAQLMQNFTMMLDKHIQENKRHMLENILGVTDEVINNELQMFGEQRAKWEKSSALINQCDSVNHSFHQALGSNLVEIRDVVSSSRDNIGATISSIQSRTRNRQSIEEMIQGNDVIRQQITRIKQKNKSLSLFKEHSTETATTSIGSVNKVEGNLKVIMDKVLNDPQLSRGKAEVPDEELHRLEKIPLGITNKENVVDLQHRYPALQEKRKLEDEVLLQAKLQRRNPD